MKNLLYLLVIVMLASCQLSRKTPTYMEPQEIPIKALGPIKTNVNVQINDTITQGYKLRMSHEIDIPLFDSLRIKKELAMLNSSTSKIYIDWNEHVLREIRLFAYQNRKWTQGTLEKTGIYFPIFEYYLRAEGVPDEIKFLSLIESGLTPAAKSRVGAVGLWQFMPSTGRLYGLQIKNFLDDRKDPFFATQAAAKYLRALYNHWGDWNLALASYNCGPGRVAKAVKMGGSKDYWKIWKYLPKETRRYVPKWMAIQYCYRYSKQYLFDIPYFYTPSFTSVKFDDDLTWDQVNILMGQDSTFVQSLNTRYDQNIIPKGYAIRVPYNWSNDPRTAATDPIGYELWLAIFCNGVIEKQLAFLEDEFMDSGCN